MTTPSCSVCSCSDYETQRRRHNYETCRNMIPHPMIPLRDTDKWFCPDHDPYLLVSR
jgi:hypothetical protein